MSIISIEITPLSISESIFVEVVENQILDNSGRGVGIEEAPINGQLWARKNADWSLVDSNVGDIDGGSPSNVYLISQSIDGGTP